MFAERMVTTAIPERVFELCQIIKKKGVPEDKLKEWMEPRGLGGKTPYFGTVRDAARQLGLISVKENEISLAVAPENVSSPTAMRAYIIKNQSLIKDSLFCAVSRAYFNMDEKVYVFSSVSEAEMVALMSKTLGKKVIEDDMRAWRFWAAYLGFGNLHGKDGMLLLPNLQQYLEAMLLFVEAEHDTEIPFETFMNIIKPYCGMILGEFSEDKKLNLGFSNGLRALHDRGLIQLSHKLDRGDVWYLYESELHAITSAVNSIVIRG